MTQSAVESETVSDDVCFVTSMQSLLRPPNGDAAAGVGFPELLPDSRRIGGFGGGLHGFDKNLSV